MVNKPLIRPAISGGGTWPGGGRLTSHDSSVPWSFPRKLRAKSPISHTKFRQLCERNSDLQPVGFQVFSGCVPVRCVETNLRSLFQV